MHNLFRTSNIDFRVVELIEKFWFVEWRRKFLTEELQFEMAVEIRHLTKATINSHCNLS